jgi:hypothetical protein
MTNCDHKKLICPVVWERDEMLAALRQCAADFVSEPCTLGEAYHIAGQEFLRRMGIARAAIAKAEGQASPTGEAAPTPPEPPKE